MEENYERVLLNFERSDKCKNKLNALYFSLFKDSNKRYENNWKVIIIK